MLRKDMRCPDEQEEDDRSSVESFPDLPNTRVNGMFEFSLRDELVIFLLIFVLYLYNIHIVDITN